MRISSMTPITRNSLLGYREVWFRYWYIMITQNNNSCNNLTFSTTGAQKSCLIVYWKDHPLIFLQGSEEANGGTNLDTIHSSATTTGMTISSGWMACSSFLWMDWHIVLKNLDLDLLVPLNDYTWPLDLCVQRPWYLLFVELLPFWQWFACHKQWLYGKFLCYPFPPVTPPQCVLKLEFASLRAHKVTVQSWLMISVRSHCQTNFVACCIDGWDCIESNVRWQTYFLWISSTTLLNLML